MGNALDQVRGLYLVDSMAMVEQCRRWAAGRRDVPLCVDTESGGLSTYRSRHRLTQLGDKHYGWAFPPEWFGAANEIITRYDGRIGMFNSPYDWRVLGNQDGLTPRWERTDDAQTAGHIFDSLRINKLKQRAAHDVDARASRGEQMMKDGMRRHHWTWDTVPATWQPYWCVPDDTEILTRDGWKKHDQIADGDETLGYSDGHLEWTEIKGAARFEDAPLVRLGNSYWATECTPNHRWLIEKNKNLALRPLVNAWKTKDTTRLIISAPAIGGSSSLTPGEASVLAWVLSDGHAHWQRPVTQTSPIAQVIQSESKFADGIRDLLRAEHAYVSERPVSGGCISFYVKASYFQRAWDKSGLRDHDLSHLVMSLSSEARHAWLATWMLAEGTTGRNVITQNRGAKLDALALCIYLEGMTPLITDHGDRCARIRMSSRQPTPQKTKITDAGRGRVWCPVTGLHTWTARDRNGNIYVTGNTYGALDPVLTAWMLDKYLPVVRAQFAASYDLELAYARVCANMMDAGMMVDIPYIHDWAARVTAWTAQAAGWLRDRYGITSVNSASQLEAALNAAGVPTGNRTPTGKAATDKETIELYAALYPHAADLLKTILWARKGEKITGTYLAKFIELADDSVIHYSIHPTGARRTGRSSVTDPAMQTYDRDIPMVRGCFVPRPGNVFISIDADQIEARLVAHFSRDQRMITDFLEADRSGGHFFLTMASKIYREEITRKDPRYTMTKNATYAQFYGSGLEKAAATAGVSVEQMRPVYEGLRTLYPDVGVMMNRIVRENKRKGHRPQIRTLTGKRLYGDPGREYALVDYKIQGSAAEVLKWGIVQLDAAGLGPFLRLPIHDEILMECPAGQAEDVLRVSSGILTDRQSFSVPLTWSGSVLSGRWRKT